MVGDGGGVVGSFIMYGVVGLCRLGWFVWLFLAGVLPGLSCWMAGPIWQFSLADLACLVGHARLTSLVRPPTQPPQPSLTFQGRLDNAIPHRPGAGPGWTWTAPTGLIKKTLETGTLI